VHRLGFYASKDIVAGTELFFNYGYPDDTTRDFIEPSGKKSTGANVGKPIGGGELVPVKSGLKTGNASSSSRRTQSSLGRRNITRRPRSHQTASNSTELAGSSQRAKKFAPNSSFPVPRRVLHRSNFHPSDGMYQYERFNFTANCINSGTGNAPSSEPAEPQEVQESDDEDDYIPEEREEDNIDTPVADDAMDLDDAGDATESLPGRSIASVVPVKRKKKKGGVRPGAGRKRKLPIPSDDEN
jgi:hypothetical protein